MFKEYVLPISAWLLLLLAFVAVATMFSVSNFKSDCADSGGNFEWEGTTTWCRY